MVHVNLKQGFLFSSGLPEDDLIDEFKMSVLHDLNHPAEIELHAIFLDVVNRLNHRIFTSSLYLLYLAFTTCRHQLQSSIYCMMFSSVTFDDSLKM